MILRRGSRAYLTLQVLQDLVEPRFRVQVFRLAVHMM